MQVSLSCRAKSRHPVNLSLGFAPDSSTSLGMTLERSGLSFTRVFGEERLECRIVPKRIPRRINFQRLQRHFAGPTQQSIQQLDCASVVTEDRINLCDLLSDLRTFECIFAFRPQIHRSLRFCNGSVLFAKPRRALWQNRTCNSASSGFCFTCCSRMFFDLRRAVRAAASSPKPF